MNEHWLKLAGRRLLPIVQGGMGIGISAHRLAGAVARENGVGTIASIDLRHHHPDLMARTRGGRDKAAIEAANLEALDREIRAARTLSEGRGLIAVNVMKAVGSHASLVRQACESGADAIGLDWTSDPKQARKTAKARVALQGNLDPAALFAPPDRVRAAARRVIDAFGRKPGHVFNLGHGVLQRTPFDGVSALVDEVLTYSRNRA